MGHFPRSCQAAVWRALRVLCGVCLPGRCLGEQRGHLCLKAAPQGPLPSPAGSHSHAVTCGDESLLDLVPAVLNILGVQDEGQVLIQHLRESKQQLCRMSKIELRLLEWKTCLVSFFLPLTPVPLSYVEVAPALAFQMFFHLERSMFVHVQTFMGILPAMCVALLCLNSSPPKQIAFWGVKSVANICEWEIFNFRHKPVTTLILKSFILWCRILLEDGKLRDDGRFWENEEEI